MVDDLEIDAAWYLSAYPDVAAAGLNPVEHYRQFGRIEGRLPKAVTALALDAKLWGGFSGPTLTELHSLFHLNHTDPNEGASAAWVLARWFASHQDWPHAERFIARLQPPLPAFLDHDGIPLLRIEVLLRSGRYAEAESVWRTAFNAHSTPSAQADLCLAAANVARWITDEKHADGTRLAWINRVFDASDLARLGKAHLALPLSLDNLTATATPYPISPDLQPKISVIMPTYNAARFVDTALRSLLRQSWSQLEVIVVDDGSTDDTLVVVQALANLDPRIVIVHQPRNLGTYAARNAGLRRATGEFITTHDADDWSHPQKLEQLAATLLADSSLMGVLAHWVRADPDLHFQHWRIETRLIEPSVSTFLFRRQALARLGCWDEVKVAADSEFYERMMAVFGRMSIRPILPEAPLVFARQWADSLTCTRATHLRTEHFGLRRLYCEFYRTWHRLADPQRGLRLLHEPSARSFPAPRTLRPMLPNPPFLQGQAESLCYDQVIMADFGEDSRGFRQVSALLRYLLETGQRVATQIIDWHSIHFIGQKLDSQRHARLLLEFLLGQIQYGSPRVQIFNIQYTTF